MHRLRSNTQDINVSICTYGNIVNSFGYTSDEKRIVLCCVFKKKSNDLNYTFIFRTAKYFAAKLCLRRFYFEFVTTCVVVKNYKINTNISVLYRPQQAYPTYF